jgi:thiol:disulfide interchange protein DsbD
MAIPYQLLMINPKWIDRLPRSGPGGELIKQVMGLLLLAVAAYFFGLAGRGAGLWGNGYWWAVQNLIIVAMAWMLLRTWQLTDRAGLRATAGIIAVVGIAFGWSLALNFATPAHDAQQFAMNVGATDNPGNPGNPGPRLWQSYSPERFQAARDAGHTVVVEFTADWCANCKVIEATVLKDQQVIDRLSGDGIVTLKVDLTSRSNAIGWDKLRSLGSRGIPLTAIYHPGREQPVMLTSIYTSAALLDALDEG